MYSCDGAINIILIEHTFKTGKITKMFKTFPEGHALSSSLCDINAT